MIPDFDDSGNLPTGIHSCTWNEFVQRFGTNLHRRHLIAGLQRAITVLKRAGCTTIYINGSFVTVKDSPADFDGCWDRRGVNRTVLERLDPTLLDFTKRRAAQKTKYGGELFFADVAANSAGTIFLDFFQTDRDGARKGIIKLDLRGDL